MGFDVVEPFTEGGWQRGFHFRRNETDVKQVPDVRHVFEPVAGEFHYQQVRDRRHVELVEAVGVIDFGNWREFVSAQ